MFYLHEKFILWRKTLFVTPMHVTVLMCSDFHIFEKAQLQKLVNTPRHIVHTNSCVVSTFIPSGRFFIGWENLFINLARIEQLNTPARLFSKKQSNIDIIQYEAVICLIYHDVNQIKRKTKNFWMVMDKVCCTFLHTTFF